MKKSFKISKKTTATFLDKILTFFLNSKVQLYLAIAICSLFAVLYSLLMLHKYWQLEYFFVDNVYFHSSLWKLAQLEEPIVHHPYLGRINIFGDHFHPMILIVAFLFRLFPWHETIFITMAVSYALGGFFAYLVGCKLIKQTWMIFVLLIAYFLYIGTQHAFIFGFHEINLLAPILFFAVWAALNKRWVFYALGIVMLLLTKESMAVIGVALSIFIWFQGKDFKKPAIFTFLVSVGWYWLVTTKIIPYFSKGQFLYGEVHLPQTLPKLVDRLITPPEKINTFLVSIASFGFLPILNIAALPLVLQDFLARYVFAIPGNVQYLLTYHYGVGLAPMLLLSAMWSIKWMEKTKWAKVLMPIFACLVLLGTFYGNFMLPQRSPLLLTINQDFYKNTKKNEFLWDLIEAVPQNGSVMTQNHLGLPLSKQTTYMLAQDYKELLELQPDYLVYDLRDGQNQNNFFPTSEKNWKQIIEQAISSGLYEEFFKKGSLYIVKKTE